MSERLFSRPEAQALLGRLRPLVLRARELTEELARGRTTRSLQALSGGNGGGGTARQVMAAGEQLRGIIAEVEAMGIVFRDPAVGLVDFPGEHEGQDIFLCWRLDEEDVGWWHPRDTGFAGRQPIDW